MITYTLAPTQAPYVCYRASVAFAARVLGYARWAPLATV